MLYHGEDDGLKKEDLQRALHCLEESLRKTPVVLQIVIETTPATLLLTFTTFCLQNHWRIRFLEEEDSEQCIDHTHNG